MPADRRYTNTAIVLHWLVALAIVANLLLGWSVNYVGEANVRPVIDLHKSIGIVALGLVLLRILWRYGHQPPPLPPGYAHWEQVASRFGHVALYVLMLATPLAGWLHDSAWKEAATHPMTLFHLIPWPRISWIMHAAPVTRERLHDLFGHTHQTLAWSLMALFAVHLGGALKHQFFDHEPELQRMMPRARR